MEMGKSLECSLEGKRAEHMVEHLNSASKSAGTGVSPDVLDSLVHRRPPRWSRAATTSRTPAALQRAAASNTTGTTPLTDRLVCAAEVVTTLPPLTEPPAKKGRRTGKQ
jgi:hypothetical protein